MANKKPIIKADANAKPGLTPEQKAEQVARFFSQQRLTLAQGALFNMMQSGYIADHTPEEIADKAVAIADAMIERLFPLPGKEDAK